MYLYQTQLLNFNEYLNVPTQGQDWSGSHVNSSFCSSTCSTDLTQSRVLQINSELLLELKINIFLSEANTSVKLLFPPERFICPVKSAAFVVTSCRCICLNATAGHMESSEILKVVTLIKGNQTEEEHSQNPWILILTDYDLHTS